MNLHYFRQSWKLFLFLVLITFVSSALASKEISWSVMIGSILLWTAWSGFYRYHIRQVRSCCQSGKFDQAIKFYENAVVFFRQDPILDMLAAAAYVGLSKPGKAIELANKAISLDPNNASVFANRSSARLQMNELALAIEDSGKAVELSSSLGKPIQAHFSANLANALERSGDIDGAIALSNKSLEMDPNCLAALLIRASCFCIKKEGQAALADLNTLEQLASENNLLEGSIHSVRARVYLSLSEQEKAMNESAMALELCPLLPSVLAVRGLALTREKKFDEALKNLSKAIELDPYNAEAYWFRYELYEKMQNPEMAESDKLVATQYQYHPFL